MPWAFDFEEWRLTLPTTWRRRDDRAVYRAADPELGELRVSTARATGGPIPDFSPSEIEKVAREMAAKCKFYITSPPEHRQSGPINIVHIGGGRNEQFLGHIWVAGTKGLLLFATYLSPIGFNDDAADEIVEADAAFRSIRLVT